MPSSLAVTRITHRCHLLEAEPRHADELRAMIVKLTRENRREPGCVAFIPYEAEQFPGRFYLYEIFADADAFEAHLETHRSGEGVPNQPVVGQAERI
jgi:quinol monooxygenase YgiN